MNKKTLKEVFEFFPKAKWITQDGGKCGIINIESKDEAPQPMVTFGVLVNAWEASDIDTVSQIDSSLLQIDWGNKRTWKQRIAKREDYI